MKFKTIAKRFAVAALAGVLAVSSMGINAAAAGVINKAETDSSITSIPVTKYVLTDGNTYKPNTTFTYSVSIGDENPGTYTDSANTTPLVVYQGVTGGLKFESTNATVSAPSTSDTLSNSYTIAGGSLTVDASVFDKTGIYHYVVTEDKGDYEGISYDQTAYDVYLFVYQNTDGTYYVGNVVTSVNGTKTDLSFTNNYGQEKDPTDPEDPNNTTHDITVTKSVTGSMGDKTKAFVFTVSVKGQVAGEIYKVVYNETATSQPVTTYVYSSNTTGVDSSLLSATISIKDGGSITVYGLSESDEVKIVENPYVSDGYTTTYKYSDNSDATALSTNGVTVKADETAVTVENNKDATTPTGIALTIAPYVLMVALAAVVAVVFLRKRSYEA